MYGAPQPPPFAPPPGFAPPPPIAQPPPSVARATLSGFVRGIVLGIAVGCLLGFFQIGLWIYDGWDRNGLVKLVLFPLYLIVGEIYGASFGGGVGAVLGTILGFARAITRDGHGPWATPQRWKRVATIITIAIVIVSLGILLSRPRAFRF